MMSATGHGFDGPVDPAIEQGAADVVREASERREAGGGMRDIGAEALAHAVLRLIADHPGQMGRLRTARVVGGFPVPHRDGTDGSALERYAVDAGWTIRELVQLVDALIGGGLAARTIGPRPVLVLTRAGFVALSALEAAPDLS
jgi:hypothetical protein